MGRDLISDKFSLVESVQYRAIRDFQLNHILSLANSAIDPLVIKGMLKNIADTDVWANEFKREKEKQSNK